MQMLIYLTPQDEIKTQPYKDYDSIREALNADHFEVAATDIPTGLGNKTMALYCDEEFLINGTDPTVNAYASIICKQPIYGNAVLLMNTIDNPDGKPDCRGFETGVTNVFSELDFIKKNIENAFDSPQLKKAAEELHKEFDNNMPEPQFEFIAYDPVEDGREDI